MEAVMLRSTGDIQPISVFWSGSFWMQAGTGGGDVIPELPNATREKNFIATSFQDPRTFKETINLICFFTERSETTAKKVLKKWIESGQLIKDEAGLYYAK